MKVGFPLKNGLPKRSGTLWLLSPSKLDDGEDEVIRLVQRVEDFIARDGDCRRPCNPPFDFDEP